VTVVVETRPDGHVVRAGPYTGEGHMSVERARRVVDAALADARAR
jgi:hypothetical protein